MCIRDRAKIAAVEESGTAETAGETAAEEAGTLTDEAPAEPEAPPEDSGQTDDAAAEKGGEAK